MSVLPPHRLSPDLCKVLKLALFLDRFALATLGLSIFSVFYLFLQYQNIVYNQSQVILSIQCH